MTEQFSEEVELFAKTESSFEFARTHWDQLRLQHPNQWVAIREGRVLATASDLRLLIAELRERGKDDNLNVIEFLPDKDTATLA